MKKSKKVACCLLVLTTSLIMSSCDKSQVSPTDPSKVVTKVEKTSSDENKDTYTITFADGSTFTFTVEHGKDGQDGEKGETGPQGPVGQTGEDGLTPKIGENGNWWIGETDTGVSASGQNGEKGNGIKEIKKTDTQGDIDTYTIYFTDGTTFTFTVTNGTTAEAKYYTVNFDLNNGEYISDIDISKYTNIKEGSTIQLPDVYREGYTFEGWYTGKGINDTRFTSYSQVNSNLTLVAKWAKMTYDGQTALTDDIRKETKRYFASMYDIYLKGEVASSNYSKYLEFIGLADFVADDNEANELIEQFVNWFYTLPVDHAMIEADLTIINEYYQNISYNYPQIAEMFNDRYNSIISQYEVATTVGEYIECVNQINSLYNDVINEINNLGNIDQERENAYNDITSQYENISSYNPFIVNYESDYQEILNIIQTAKTSDDIKYAYERFNELTSSADTDYNIATNSRDSLVNNLNQAYEMYNSQFELSEEDHISYQDLSNQLYDDKNLTNLDYLTGEVSIYIERLQTNYGELDLTSKKEELINDLDYKIEDLTNQFGEDKLQNYLETFESYRTTINESNSILELLNLQNDINNYYEQIYNELSFDYEYRDNILNNLAESWNVLTERFGKTSLEEYQSTYDYYYELVSNCTNTDELYKYENEINEFLVYVTENLENQYESLRNDLMNQFVSELENITQQLNNLYDLSSDEKYGPLVQEAINNLQSLPVDELDDYYANTIEPLLSELNTYKDELLAKAVYIQFYPEFPVIGLSLWLTSSPKPYFVGDTITLTQEDLDNMFAPVSGFSVDKVYLDKEHQQEINLTEGVYLDGETYLAQQTYYFYMTYVITDLDLAKQTFNQILVTIKENMATYYPTYEESLTAIADKYMAMLDTISTPEDLLSAMEEYNSEMLQVEIGIFVEQMQMSFDELSKQNPDVLNYQDEFDGYVEQIKGATSEQELSNIINEFNDFIMQFYEIPIETNA